MSSNTALDAINPHTYGLKAADACDAVINQILVSTDQNDIIRSIHYINDQIPHPDDRGRAFEALIQFSATGDRDAAAQIIKGHEYLAAYLHLGKQMHALAMMDKAKAEHLEVLQLFRPLRGFNQIPVHPARDEKYQPAVTSITEILCETIQASNAPSAAIPAATISI